MSTYSELSVLEDVSPTLKSALLTNDQAIRQELANGLLAENATISPKYLYDRLGSELFEAICLLPEYYPTRTETAIFRAHSQPITQAVGQGSTLIDLGAGNCAKAARLFPVLQPKHYVPIDISIDFLQRAVAPLKQSFPNIKMMPLGQDFSASLNLPKTIPSEKRVFFYPGSSIGNFSPTQALAFLHRIHAACDADGAILMGIDLIKNQSTLSAAYDDALGITAAFNLNVLRNVNNLLGSDFNVSDWVHRAFFNRSKSRIEMHLQAQRPVLVSWAGGQRRFAPNDSIHTENSYKYTQASIITMLKEVGFKNAQIWTDTQDWFAVVYARAA